MSERHVANKKPPKLRLISQDDNELKRRLAMELASSAYSTDDSGGDDGTLLQPDSRAVLTDLDKQEALLMEQIQGHSKIAAVLPHIPKSDINKLQQNLGESYQNSTHPLLGDLQRWDGIGLEDTTINPSPLDNPLAYDELQHELQKQQQKRLELQQQLSSTIANNMTLKR